MPNGDEFPRVRHHYHHHKKSSRKRDDSESRDEKLDLRNRLNELKKSKDHPSRDRSSGYDKEQYPGGYSRTKQVHDYEPYHKSSIVSSSVITSGANSSHSRSSHHRSHNSSESRSKAYSDRDRISYKPSSSRHSSRSNESSNHHTSPERSSKQARIIKDAEVNEIISEEEDKTSESEAGEDAVSHSSKGSGKDKSNSSHSESDNESHKSDGTKESRSVSSKQNSDTGSNDEKMSDDLESREARMKAKLKEKYLKSQLHKKYKESKSKKKDKERTPDSMHHSRSSSVTIEPSVSSQKDDSNEESPKSSKRTRNTHTDDSSQSSDDTEKYSGSNRSKQSDNESSDALSDDGTKKHSNGHKKRKSNGSVGTGSDTEMGDESGDEKKKSRKKASPKSRSRTPSLDKSDEIKSGTTKEISQEVISEEPIQQVPETIMYYCATQGCRSVEEFECLNKIEEGAYGVVYRAKDKKSDEVVALKRLKMEKEREGFPITSIREVDTLLKSQHINVVTVREIVVGSNMDKIYMVMDYVEHDLKSLMQHGMKKNFQMSEVKCLMKQILSGIAHLHDNWIIHRDLKTSNLLLSHKGILKIADFGLAREYGSPLKEYTPVVVTLWYRCPELLLNTKKYSTSVDMWSIGTIFGELMLLKALFPGKNEKDQLDKIFKDLGTPNNKIWPGFKDLPLTKKMNFPEFPYNTLRSRFGNYLSDNGFNLINKLLTYDPEHRISADEAKSHVFFNETPFPIDPSLFPTWPAKSEGASKPKKIPDSEPKAPSAGKLYDQLLQDDNSFVLQFPAVSAGFTLR